jgi:hypothetical protein
MNRVAASLSGLVEPVIIDCRLVSLGGGSAGGLIDAVGRASISVVTRCICCRRVTWHSHLAEMDLAVLFLAKPLLIFNVGASDGAIEA